MISIQDKSKCSGCGACYSACPSKCIFMVADREGFLYPEVNEELCSQCGICDKVCPIIHPIIEIPIEQKGYLVQHKNDIVRNESTSGGAFTGIATWVIKKGGVVFGAAYDESFSVKHIFIETESDLYKFRNSKYVQSEIGDSYILVKKFLDSGRWVCFSGTPCQIEGLNSLLGKKYERLVLVDVVCHGVPSPLIWKKYLEYLNVLEEKPDIIRFRDKYYGYKYSTMSIIKNGKNTYHAGSQMDPMLRAFFSDICDRPICYSCPFKKQYRVSDITIWDCFTVFRFLPKIDDDKGTTRMLCHSEIGKNIANELVTDCNIYESSVDALVAGVKEMKQSVQCNCNRDMFFVDSLELSGKLLFEKYFPINNWVRIKTKIRYVLLVSGLYKVSKRILNILKRR